MSTPPHSRARLSTQRTEEGTTRGAPSLKDSIPAIDSQNDMPYPVVCTARGQHTSGGQSLGNISQWNGQRGMSNTYRYALDPDFQVKVHERLEDVPPSRTFRLAQKQLRQHKLRESEPPLQQPSQMENSAPLTTLPAKASIPSFPNLNVRHNGGSTINNHCNAHNCFAPPQPDTEAWRQWKPSTHYGVNTALDASAPRSSSSQHLGWPITNYQRSVDLQQREQHPALHEPPTEDRELQSARDRAMYGMQMQMPSQELSDRSRSSLHTENAESISGSQGVPGTMTLTEWMANNSLPDKLSDNDGGAKVKELRKKIIHVAFLIAEEVLKDGRAGRLYLRNILSPNNFILTNANNLAELKVSIQVQTDSNDAPFMAPWRKNKSRDFSVALQALGRNAQEYEREQMRYDYNACLHQAVIFALGALFRTLCEGGTTFLQDDNYNWCRLFEDGNNQKVYSHWDFFSRWKFFILAHACLQVEKGNIYGIPDNPLIEIDIKKVIDILRESADEEYANSDEINVHLDHLRAQIAHNYRTVYSFIPFE